MKNKDQKQCSGVWLDSNDAIIISNTRGKDGCYVIQERMKANDVNNHGDDRKMSNVGQPHSINYFRSISKLLLDYDEIFVFGPENIHKQFLNYLNQDKQFHHKRITCSINSSALHHTL
jgi:stalled ribosome rescue protein Dom34